MPSPAAALLAAAAKRRGVRVTEAGPIQQIAALIGGIPLALELAACQLQFLEPAALLRSLNDPIDALVDPRQSLGRHRSMRACFQLALARLGTDATDLFALVSRRPNGCPYDDLAAWWGRQTPLPRAVAELVEVGFAATGPDAAGVTRLLQLPLVRAFGSTLPRAVDADTADGALDLAVLGRAQASITATRSTVVEPDLPDIRRLLQRGIDDPGAVDGALQLAVLLTVYWWSARITEGRQMAGCPARRRRGPAIGDPSVRGVHRGFLDFYVGDAESAARRLDDALLGDLVDPMAHARLLALRAMLDAAEGAHERCGATRRAGDRAPRAAGDDQSLFFALGNAGDVATVAGDVDTARGLLRRVHRTAPTGAAWIGCPPPRTPASATWSCRGRVPARQDVVRTVDRTLVVTRARTRRATVVGWAGRLDVVEGD